MGLIIVAMDAWVDFSPPLIEPGWSHPDPIIGGTGIRSDRRGNPVTLPNLQGRSVQSPATMELLQFAVAEPAVIIGICIKIVELAKFHIFGAGDGAIAIAVHQPKALGLADLGALFPALTLAGIAADGAGAKPNCLKFLQTKPAIAIGIKRAE